MNIIAKLFKKIVREENTDIKNTFELFKKGILVEEPVSDKQKEVLLELYGIDMANINSTFYKTFEEADSYTFEEQRLLQAIHYLSTYNDIEELKNHGDIFEPLGLNTDLLTQITPVLTTIEVVDSYKDLVEDIEGLLSKGIALNQNEVIELCDVINDNEIYIDINKIKNKDMLIVMAKKIHEVPEDPDLFASLLHYMFTNDLMYIKGKKELKNKVLMNCHGMDFNWNSYRSHMTIKNDIAFDIRNALQHYIDQYGIENLAKSYRPHKYLYLFIRKQAKTKKTKDTEIIVKIINKISYKNKSINVPKKNEIPLNKDMTDEQIDKLLKSMNIFQMVKMYNSAMERLSIVDEDIQVYKIRNGKTFAKKLEAYSVEDKQRYLKFIVRIEQELKDRYEEYFKNVNIVLPEMIHLAMPTTLKNSVGNIPSYSYVYIPEDANLKIGASWDKQADIDIHGQTFDGEHIGFYGGGIDSISHSGDMTRLNEYGFAAEYFLVKNEAKKPLMFSVSEYWRDCSVNNLNFKFIIAEDKGKKDTKRIIDPEEIYFFTDIEFQNERSMNLGLIVKDENPKFIFNKSSQFRMIPDDEINSRMVEPVLRKAKTSMMLEDFLKIVGYEDKEEPEKVVDLNKNNIIDFIKEIA